MRLHYAGLLIATLAAVQPLAAAPITYTETGQLSGTIGTTPLTNSSFTFVFYGDTANITGSGVFLNTALSNSIVIGASSGSFTTVVEVGVNPSGGILGFTDTTISNGITFASSGAVGYGLATPIAVSSSTSTYAGGTLVTSFGPLSITGAQNLSFTATTGVPEPGTLGLMSFALFGFLVVSVRRTRSAPKGRATP